MTKAAKVFTKAASVMTEAAKVITNAASVFTKAAQGSLCRRKACRNHDTTPASIEIFLLRVK